MIVQEFTAVALNRLRRAGGQFKYREDGGGLPGSQAEWAAFFGRLQDEILNGDFRFRPFSVRSLPKCRRMFSTKSIENIMVMRKINDNIRRAYRLKQSNRFDIIRQVQQGLRETTPKYVIRLDIKSFYETVPKRRLINRLRADRLVSTRTVDLLDRLLRYTSHLGAQGLPRGLQISSTLAELHAKSLDDALREITGVYYVARYVDDIVLFSYVPTANIEKEIAAAFAKLGLTPNVEKEGGGEALSCKCAILCAHQGGQCPCVAKCKCKPDFSIDHIRHIDILGYRIAFSSINEKKKSAENIVRIYLADKKIAKYKSRIHLAVADYSSTLDFDLLRDRILFLTGNYRLESTKIGGDLRGGIYYNFDLYEPLEDPSVYAGNRLDALDQYLNIQLLRVFASPLSLTTASRKRGLLSISFVNGHARRRMRNFQARRMQEIGACWNEA